MRRLPLPFVLSTAAVLWSLALVGVAYFVPVYSGESETGSCTPGGHCTSTTVTTSATLVQENGDRVVVIIAVLAGIAVIGWLGLHLHCAMGSRFGPDRRMGCRDRDGGRHPPWGWASSPCRRRP